jgi:hypothetical protein
MRGKSKQNMYNMKGCSKTKTKTRKNKLFLGGATDLRLAYPSKGLPSGGFDFLNPQTGGCDGQCAIIKGGAIMKGGNKSHKCNCACKTCQNAGAHSSTCTCKACQKKRAMIKGGASLPYPNGLLGNAWTPSISGWPGVDGISMGRNHLAYNTYDNDVSRQMRDVGANPPFTYLKGGKRRKTSNKRSIKNKRRTSKTQKGGINFLGQDLINIGRQFQYGVGSAYNGIRGFTSPVNPLPWKDQFK